MSHVIPFIGLVVISYIGNSIEFTENKGEYIIVYMAENAGN